MDFYNHGDQLLWNKQIKQRNQLLECQQLGTTEENRKQQGKNKIQDCLVCEVNINTQSFGIAPHKTAADLLLYKLSIFVISFIFP